MVWGQVSEVPRVVLYVSKPVEMIEIKIPQAMMDAALADEHGDDVTILTNFVLEAGALHRKAIVHVERGLKYLEGLTIKEVYLGYEQDRITFDTVEEGPITFAVINRTMRVDTWCITGMDAIRSKVSAVNCDGDDPEKRSEAPSPFKGYKWTLILANGFIAKVWINGGSSFDSSKRPGPMIEHVPMKPQYRVLIDVNGR